MKRYGNRKARCVPLRQKGFVDRNQHPLPVYELFVVLLLIGLLFSACALKTKPPLEPSDEKDLFQGFPKKYRRQALNYESIGDLQNSLFCWKIVAAFLPGDKEAEKSINRIRNRIERQAEKHFRKGLSLFHNESYEASRKEFLYTVALDPNHNKALEYLKNRLNDQNYIQYETKDGETPASIAHNVYKDQNLEELVVFFTGFKEGSKIAPGQKLKLPKLKLELKKRSPRRKMASLEIAKSKFNDKEYEIALSLAKSYLKNHPDDKEALDIIEYSTYQLAVDFFRKKHYGKAQKLLENLSPEYRNVKQLLNYIQRHHKSHDSD